MARNPGERKTSTKLVTGSNIGMNLIPFHHHVQRWYWRGWHENTQQPASKPHNDARQPLLAFCAFALSPNHRIKFLHNEVFFHSVQGLPQGLLQVGSPFVQKVVQDSAILAPQLDHWGRIQGSRWWVLHVVWAIGAMAVLHSTTAFVKAIKDWKFDSMGVWSRGWSVLTGGDEAKNLMNVVSKLYWLWKTWHAPKRSGCAHRPPKNRN